MIPDLKTLSPEEKMRCLANLWEDMRSTVEQSGESKFVRDLLDERTSRVEQGTATLHDWDTVKGAIDRS